MKIVIDIPNELYANLKKIQNGSIACSRILKLVQNGIPFEKGENCINREAVIEVLTNNYRMKALEEIQKLPSVQPSLESTDRIVKEFIWLIRRFRDELNEEFKENIEGITDEFVQDLIISDAIHKKMSEEMPDKWFECCCFRG